MLAISVRDYPSACLVGWLELKQLVLTCMHVFPIPASISGEHRLPGVTEDKQFYIEYALGDAQVVRAATLD